MKSIKGNLIALAKDKQFNVILHGCNCFNTWGAGIALEMKKNFPRAYRADMLTLKGDKNKLGTYTSAYIEQYELSVINCYTQYKYGRGVQADYKAMEEVFKKVSLAYPDSVIGFPKIGAGLAGGDWNVISKILEETLPNAWYVEYDNN